MTDISIQASSDSVGVVVKKFDDVGGFVIVKITAGDTEISLYFDDIQGVDDLASKLMNATLYPMEVNK